MADRLMADVDGAFGEQIFDVPKRQRVLSESGYFTYINSARRMISGELLKYLNGLRIR
jgi:hypothetical protein